MQGVGGHARSGEAIGQLAGEQDVGELALAVRLKPRIAFPEFQVVPAHPARTVGLAADVDHPRIRRRLEQVQQFLGQQKIIQVVQGEGHLDPFRGFLARGDHGTGVVEQHVEAAVPGAELGGDPAHLGHHAQIGHDERGGPDLTGDLGGLGGATAHDHHLRSQAGEGAGRRLADAARGPGDQHRLACHVSRQGVFRSCVPGCRHVGIVVVAGWVNPGPGLHGSA